MKHFYEPDLTSNPDSPFIRDGNNKLVRRSYWMDMDDRTLVMVMTKGIGAHLKQGVDFPNLRRYREGLFAHGLALRGAGA